MNKIFNKFLIGLLFVLGIMLVPTYKVDAVITVIVKADDVAANKTVLKDSTVKISWEATGATSCSEGKGRGGTGTYGAFTIDSIQETETFTVNCYAPDAPAVCPTYSILLMDSETYGDCNPWTFCKGPTVCMNSGGYAVPDGNFGVCKYCGIVGKVNDVSDPGFGCSSDYNAYCDGTQTICTLKTCDTSGGGSGCNPDTDPYRCVPTAETT